MTDSRMTATPLSRVTSLIFIAGPLAASVAGLGIAPPARGEDVVFTRRVMTSPCGPVVCPERRFTSIFATDLDGDEDIDVLSVVRNDPDTVLDDEIVWYESDGVSPSNFAKRVISTGGALSVYAADLDSDGDIDVISNTGAWYESDGGSPPIFNKQIVSTGGAWYVTAADMEGDGDIDVLSASSEIKWHESDGGSPPTFTERVIPSATGHPTTLYATDLDGDGDTDLLATFRNADTVAWYENDGGSPPGFSERVISANADYAVSVFATDLDGDGDTDVLSASQDDDKIAWYESDGASPPSFTERVISDTAFYAWSVSAADLDGDGDTDVVAATRADARITWYENDGGSPPIFTERVLEDFEPTGGGLWGSVLVLATDLDSDGRTDVLAAWAGTHTDAVAWYWNTDCTQGAAPVTVPSLVSQADQSKNRFLSVVPGNEGHPTALRVTLVSSLTYPGDVGKQWWVGPPRARCENSGQVAIPAGGCGPAPGIPKNAFWQS